MKIQHVFLTWIILKMEIDSNFKKKMSRGWQRGVVYPTPYYIWKLSSWNRVTPDPIPDGVQHLITFTALVPIPAVIGDSAAVIADLHETPKP